jgi:hypothetical protein
MSREMLGKTTVETSFSKKSNTYYMKVLCVQGYENILTESEVYTVSQVTPSGNYLLEEVEVPEGYTSFNQNRFVPLISTDSDEWTEEMEQQYWEEQPNI